MNRLRAGVLALGLIAAVALGASPAQAEPIHPALLVGGPVAAEENEDGLVVKVVDPATPTPAPTPAPSSAPATPAPQAPRPAAPGATLPQVSQQTLTEPADADAALGEGSESMAGLIYVSTARTAPSLTLHPDGGAVAVVLTVRSVAGETIDGAAKFWLTTAWGWPASPPIEVDVPALSPGETRELTATLSGPGQWTFYQAHAEFTPPASVDGVELSAITRTENFLILPLFTLGIAIALAAAVGVVVWGSRVLGRREELGE